MSLFGNIKLLLWVTQLTYEDFPQIFETNDYNHLNYHKSKTTTNKLSVTKALCACNKAVETVSHFLLDCTNYQNQRHDLLIKIKKIIKENYPNWLWPKFDEILLYDQLTLELLLVASNHPAKVANKIIKGTCSYITRTGRKI